MSEPYWVALGSKIPIDYIGGWSAGVSYKAGDVVSYNGIDYIAVNPSMGSTPPPLTNTQFIAGVGTAFPTSPYNDQEYVLTDSLTAPTYSWRFKYVATIADAYKWVFIGGADWHVANDGPWTYAGVYTPIIGLTVPRAGLYNCRYGAHMGNVANETSYCAPKLGAAAVSGANAVSWYQPSAGASNDHGLATQRRFTLAAGDQVVMHIATSGGNNGLFKMVWLAAQPVRLS